MDEDRLPAGDPECPAHSRRDVLRAAGAAPALPGLDWLDGGSDPAPAVGWTRWSTGESYLAPLATGHGAVYALTEETLVSVSRATGRRNWTFEGWAFVRPADVRESTVYARAREPDRLLALDPADGGIRWQAAGVTRLEVRDGTVYTFDGDLAAYASPDGAERWRFPTNGDATDLVVDRDVVVVGTNEGSLHAVDRADGTERWRYDAPAGQLDAGLEPAAIRRTPGSGGDGGRGADAAGTDRTLYALDTTAFRVLALSVAEGRVRWTYDLENGTPIHFPGAFGEDAVFVQDGRELVALSVADGSEIWQLTADSELEQWRPVEASTDRLFTTDYDSVSAVSKADGSLHWRFEHGEDGSLGVRSAARDGITVTTSERTPEDVFRLDATDGRVRWRFECDCELASTVTADDGTVYVGTEDGRLFSLSDPGPGPLAVAADAATRLGPPALGAGLVAGGAFLGVTRLLGSAGDSVSGGGPALDEFEVLERTGSRAHTERYAAALPDREDPVTLVRLRPDARDDPGLVAAFESGVETAAGLAVDGVPSAVAWRTTPEPWLATELPAEDSLADRTDDMPPGDRLDAVASAARVVHAAHEQGVVHGRLAPDCVRFAEEPPASVQVVDWELRDLPLPDDRGTDPYAAPEQVGDDHATATPATDVYRLGAVAYRVLTDRFPFGDDPGPGDFETGLRPPTDVDAGLPAALDRRLGRALSVRPGDRHESAGRLADALRYGVPRD